MLSGSFAGPPEFARRRITEGRKKGEKARKALLFLWVCDIIMI